ncbi:MAG: hypothetical protein HFH14_06720 [Lachnospiraceae bacterium]|nr:hypothetical protein [Lachnospiraceae bacterium]
MKKSDIKKMIDEIDDRYVEEASGNIKNADKIYIRHYSKIAVAASICLLVVGSGVSVLAATNPAVKSWIRSFYVEDVEEDFGHGIKITNESINTENVSDEGTEAIAESEEVE